MKRLKKFLHGGELNLNVEKSKTMEEEKDDVGKKRKNKLEMER